MESDLIGILMNPMLTPGRSASKLESVGYESCPCWLVSHRQIDDTTGFSLSESSTCAELYHARLLLGCRRRQICSRRDLDITVRFRDLARFSTNSNKIFRYKTGPPVHRPAGLSAETTARWIACAIAGSLDPSLS